MKQILTRLALTLPVVWLVVSLVFLLIYTGYKADKDAVKDYKEMEKAMNRKHRIQRS